MLDHIDTLAVREMVARMAGRERELAELSLAGHSLRPTAFPRYFREHGFPEM